jgi:DNA-binding MarR family transcriptional regulator
MAEKATTVTELDKELAHSIRDLVSRLNRRLRKQISNPDQLSVAELNIIMLLADSKQLFPSDLCLQLNLSSQYVSQVLNNMEALGLISRKAAETDKRKTYAVITQKGRKVLNDTRQEREEWLARAIANMYSIDEKHSIQEVVTLLVGLTER